MRKSEKSYRTVHRPETGTKTSRCRLGANDCRDRLAHGPTTLRGHDDMSELLLQLVTFEQAALTSCADTCAVCDAVHDPAEPHNAVSLAYQSWFAEHNRRGVASPSWADAMAHCTADIQSEWTTLLAYLGVDPEEPISERHEHPASQGNPAIEQHPALMA